MSAVAILSAPTSPVSAPRGGDSVDANAFGALLADTQGDGVSGSALGTDGKAVGDDLAPAEAVTPPGGGVVVALPLPLVVPKPVIAPAPENVLLDEATEVSPFQPDVTTAVPVAPALVTAQTLLTSSETPAPQTQPSSATLEAPAQGTDEPTPVATQQTADAEAKAQADAKTAVAAAARPATDAALLASTGLVSPSQGDAVRTRDVIDRALQRTTTEASNTGESATSGGEQTTHPTDAFQAKTAPDARPTTTVQTPAEIVAATLNAPAETGPEPVVQGGSASATTEAHGVTAQDLTLSSLARATIETTAQLAAQITRRLEGRYTRFELALTPEGLGRVDVSLDIDSDGQLAARLAFDNPAAAADLRGRADELRRQLEDAGFRIAHDGLDFAERDPSSGGGFDRRQGQDGGRAFAGASRLAAQADTAPAQWINLNLTPRGVDMKV